MACQLLHHPCQHTIGSPDTFSQPCLKNICLQIITVFDLVFPIDCLFTTFFSGGPQTEAGITWDMEQRVHNNGQENMVHIPGIISLFNGMEKVSIIIIKLAPMISELEYKYHLPF